MLYLPQYFRQCTKCGERFPATTQYFYLTYDRNKKKRLSSACKICNIKRVHAYAIQNREKIADRHRVYSRSHRQQIRDWAQQDRAKKPNQYRARQRRYCANHQDKIKEKNRQYRINNKIQRRETKHRNYLKYRGVYLNSSKHYRKSHRAQYAVYARNRRATRIAVGGEHVPQDIQRQYKVQKGKCYWCDCKLDGKYHVDHVIPLSKGGTNDPSNLVVTCPTCNLSKNDKYPWEWEGNNGKLF